MSIFISLRANLGVTLLKIANAESSKKTHKRVLNRISIYLSMISQNIYLIISSVSMKLRHSKHVFEFECKFVCMA